MESLIGQDAREAISHPYYPPGAAIRDYAPNTLPLPFLLASFGAILGIILTSALVLAKKAKTQFRDTSIWNQALYLWFILCYFVFNHATLASSHSLPAQLWKEYALSDSRYLTSDPFTLCVEAITVFVWGPLCWATAMAIAMDSGHGKSHSLRFPLQMLASLAHLYGVALYYGTVVIEVSLRGVFYCRPEFVYVWVYFIGMNAPWVVVPAAILYCSFLEVSHGFISATRMAVRKTN